MTRLLRCAFWSAAAVAFTMAVLPNPPHLPGGPSDKVQHMLAFAVLAALASAAYRNAAPLRIGVLLSAFGAAIEAVQLIPALHRWETWSIGWPTRPPQRWCWRPSASGAYVWPVIRHAAQAASRADSANQV